MEWVPGEIFYNTSTLYGVSILALIIIDLGTYFFFFWLLDLLLCHFTNLYGR